MMVNQEIKYGMLSVLEYTDKRSSDNRPIVLCRCDCGTICERNLHNMKQGETKSCGCLRREKARASAQKLGKTFGKINGPKNLVVNKMPFGTSAFNRLYGAYKHNSKKANIEFDLTKEEFKQLTSSNCYYCGSKPEKTYKCHRGNGYYLYNGVDKVNPDVGYVPENCVASCWVCNLMKHRMEVGTFLKQVELIYKNHFEINQ